MALLNNTIQDYAWGSRVYLAGLRGEEASSKPEAELWMGAHPKAPSRIGDIPLDQVIRQDPEGVLGPKIVARFGAQLPFLFKLLAAAQPLSIQAHPNLEQAREGFARENEAGIPIDAPHRNYRDPNHKPEIICALTEFWGLNGFRAPGEIIQLFAGVEHEQAALLRDDLRRRGDEALRDVMKRLWELPLDEKKQLVQTVLAAAAAGRVPEPERSWLEKVNTFYPGDVGVLGVLLLNLVHLQPGQAMFCEAGILHAYLEGLGVELMANSDNVLRGGLTSKHVDIPELMRVLHFQSRQVAVLTPDENGYYPSSVEEFRLRKLNIEGAAVYTPDRAASILVCTEGRFELVTEAPFVSLQLGPSASVFCCASSPPVRIEGTGVLYAAEVNLP
ncbi:MAG: mannose-6-phosphate isomerase, class I [Lentisphaerae bacterium]|nr:MAG: mannose-6-phosphate isomerase, class I [Lentisphaerota bacterium]